MRFPFPNAQAWLTLALAGWLLTGIVGCGSGDPAPGEDDATDDGGSPSSDADSPDADAGDGASTASPNKGIAAATPDEAVRTFLDAVRTGDDATAAELLTDIARTKTAERQMAVAPPGSDTAEFTVGGVDVTEGGIARVQSVWTDRDETGAMRSDHILWMLREEGEGWRIAGMAAEVFEGEPPLLLNFEDPDDMIRQQQMLREEIARREQASMQASRPDASGDDTIRQ